MSNSLRLSWEVYILFVNLRITAIFTRTTTQKENDKSQTLASIWLVLSRAIYIFLYTMFFLRNNECLTVLFSHAHPPTICLYHRTMPPSPLMIPCQRIHRTDFRHNTKYIVTHTHHSSSHGHLAIHLGILYGEQGENAVKKNCCNRNNGWIDRKWRFVFIYCICHDIMSTT